MKKIIKRFCLALGSCVIFAFCLCGCSSDNSIIGTWTVKEYELNGERVSTDDIGEYMGVDFASRNDSSLVFQKSGHVKIYLPYGGGYETDTTVNYTVTDNIIELYEDDYSEYLELDNNAIKAEVGSEIFIIFHKK